EKTAVEMDEKPPMLPIWLSPTEVRIIPISERHLDFSLSLANELKENHIRVDVDDRQETVGKKIRSAGKEWVPYTIVIGDKELESGKLIVNVRETNDKILMEKEELINKILSETQGMPFRPLPLPLKLSRRVNF
ncbi:MAG: His/Gly/Thr/Pro-type tRNA ligase C-terminal domain-containing protein, partial [Methanobacterium sp.]